MLRGTGGSYTLGMLKSLPHISTSTVFEEIFLYICHDTYLAQFRDVSSGVVDSLDFLQTGLC